MGDDTGKTNQRPATTYRALDTYDQNNILIDNSTGTYEQVVRAALYQRGLVGDNLDAAVSDYLSGADLSGIRIERIDESCSTARLPKIGERIIRIGIAGENPTIEGVVTHISTQNCANGFFVATLEGIGEVLVNSSFYSVPDSPNRRRRFTAYLEPPPAAAQSSWLHGTRLLNMHIGPNETSGNSESEEPLPNKMREKPTK